MSATDDLIAFLRARLDEDEQAARRWRLKPDVGPIEVTGGHDPDTLEVRLGNGAQIMAMGHADMVERFHDEVEPDKRQLAEVNAKRRIVDECVPHWPEYLRVSDDFGAADLAEKSIKLLASVYACHPDYREEWRP